MDTSENWENEGGKPLQSCAVCGKVKPLYEDDKCLSCWLIVNPIHGS